MKDENGIDINCENCAFYLFPPENLPACLVR